MFVSEDLETLRDRDAVLSTREAVLRIQERPCNEGKGERREGEVVPAQAHQRHADHERDRRAHERRGGHGEEGVDPGLGVD